MIKNYFETAIVIKSKINCRMSDKNENLSYFVLFDNLVNLQPLLHKHTFLRECVCVWGRINERRGAYIKF